MINRFAGEYRFLSNFYPCTIKYGPFNGEKCFDGESEAPFPSVEHAFQASKTMSVGYQRSVRDAATPQVAKQYGRLSRLRDDWEEVKVRLMEGFLRQKFSDPELKNKLILTGAHELIEGNTWHDNIWGDCRCSKCRSIQGQNMLGKLLMKIRAELMPTSDPRTPAMQEVSNQQMQPITITCRECGKQATYPPGTSVKGEPIEEWFASMDHLCKECRKPIQNKESSVTQYIKDKYVVGGTGSRTVNDKQALEWMFNELGKLKEAHPNLVVMSGFAQGWDYYLARAAVKHNIPWVAILPNPDYINYYHGPRGSTDGQNHITEALALLKTAAAVETVMPSPKGTNGRYGGANFDRNTRMVELGHHFLVFDAQSPGTSDCVGKIVRAHKTKKVYGKDQ